MHADLAVVVVVPVVMTPSPVFALLLAFGFRPVIVFAVLLFEVMAVSPIFPFIPFMPIVVFTIVVPLDAISMIVVFIRSHGDRRDQGYAQTKCTQVTMHSTSRRCVSKSA